MRAQFVVLAFLLAAGSSVLLAQSYQGEIVGAVTDVSGSLIPEAQLSLIQMDTGRQQAARADAQGRFRFLQLPPGRYRLEVQHPGFRKSQQSLTLEVGSRALVDVALQVGELTESVVVSEEAPLVEAASGAVGMLVDNSRITSLPLNGRNAFELVALSPGVIPTGSFGQSDPWDKRAPASFSASGGRGLANDLLLDGASATVGSELNLAAFSPALDAIQEFKVQLNSYAAEFGRSQGAVVNAVTRAGTNRFHGSAYDYLRNDNLDANNFFNNAAGRPKADLRWNQFGGTLGGPVVMPRLYDGRNRTFFFVSYEGMRYARGLSSLLRVPTSVERGGDFSQTVDARGLLVPIYDPSSTRPDPARPNRYLRSPFPGNRIPAGSLNPVAARVAPFYPLPNQKELFPAAPNFYFGGNFVYGSDQTLVKLDHSFSERHRLSFRYSHAADDRRNPLSYGNIASPVLGPNQEASKTALLEHTWLLRPTLVANLKLNFLRYGNTIATYGAGYKFADELGMPRSLEDQSDFPMFPAFNVVGMPVGFAPGPPMVRTRPFSWNPTGSLSWVRGAHGLKFGFDYRAIYANNFIPQAPSGNYTFTPGVTGGPDPDATGPTGSALASFLLGVPANGSFGKSLALALRNSYTAFYVQDDWRVNARLTLNIGLRWDNEGSFTERYDRLTYLDLGSPNPIAAAANASYSRILGQLRASAPATAAVLPATLDLRGGLGYATPQERRQVTPERNNFAPRFAFAYSLSPRWVVRGGFGIFYTPQTGFAVAAAGLAQGYEAITRVSGLGADRTPVVTLSNPFPAGLVQPAGKSLGLATDVGGAINSTLRTNRGGYAEQWNLNVQRSLGRGAVVEAGYIGSHGVKLIGPGVAWNDPSPAVAALGPTVLNTVIPNPFLGVAPPSTTLGSLPTTTVGQMLLPFPQFTAVTSVNENLYNSNYHALTLRIEKRMSHGLTFLTSYTAGKSIDDGSGWIQFQGQLGQTGGLGVSNRRLDRSISAFDKSQRLVTVITYELPFGAGRKFGSRSWLWRQVGGWQVSAVSTFMTGLPIAMSRSAYIIGDVHSPDSGQGRYGVAPSNPWLNPGAFRSLTAGQVSNIPRTMPDLRGPGTANTDLSLFKIFRLTEGVRLQLRGEFFNAFNRTELGSPQATPLSPTYGLITSTARRSREVQIGVRLVF